MTNPEIIEKIHDTR